MFRLSSWLISKIKCNIPLPLKSIIDPIFCASKFPWSIVCVRFEDPPFVALNIDEFVLIFPSTSIYPALINHLSLKWFTIYIIIHFIYLPSNVTGRSWSLRGSFNINFINRSINTAVTLNVHMGWI